MTEVREYLSASGHSPFGKWFDGLDVQAAAKITAYLTRIGNGNFSRVESVGNGVYECRIDYGPGYRVYFGKDGEKLIVLLGGGTKKGQKRDIHGTKALWLDYKERRQKEEKWH